jgi:quercetin dioxygenase-like cupin family protein
MQRRDLLALSGAAMLLAGSRAHAQAGIEAINEARLRRIFATSDGESHIEELVISQNAAPISITRMTTSAYRGSGATRPDWHTAPRRQFAINMTGELEVEISNGDRHQIGPGDLIFLEDLTGKGHVTRVLTPVTNLFLHVPEDFDVVAWARGA